MAVVFVTTELDPVLPGGAGAVVAQLATGLSASGEAARVVLVTEDEVDAAAFPPGVQVTVAIPDTALPTPFLARSATAARTLAEVAEAGDRVEFVDFHGLGYRALVDRAAHGLAQTLVTVRVHGPVDLLAEGMGVEPPDWPPVRVMEAEAYRMADAVLAPGEGVARLVTARYGLEPDRVLVGQPPIPPVQPVERRPAPTPELACVGRLGEMKGSHDLVDAAVALLDARIDLVVRFVGEDGWSVEGARPMRDWLAERIPARYRDAIRFEEPVPRRHLPAVLSTAWAVVVPSRFESFCLAAHEARRLGHPVVVPDLPAFEGLLDRGTGALVYDGTVAGLVATLRRLVADARLRDELSRAPLPDYRDPLEPYRSAPPAPRHPRVQAGLGTAAAKRVEEALAAMEPPPRPGVTARVARTVMRRLPDPVARAAVRLLPGAAKDRFRRLADWREEQARREEEDRRAALDARIAAGEFAELDAPDVTVVIPCYNHGRFVEDAIRSVFRQTHPSWEIVVVDDGSDGPATVAVLDALDWPRTRLVRQANKGLPGARNAGMRVARGRYLVPLDADDELAPEFCEALLAALAPQPEAAFAQCWSELFGDQWAIWVPRPYNPYQLLLSNSVVGCVLLRREAWEAAGGYAEDMTEGNEDWDLWLRLVDAGWGQVTVPRPLFRYRKHGVSMSVETEARFERARLAMPGRHPFLYAPDRVRALKAEHYPWVSVLVSDDAPARDDLERQDIDDLEVVRLGEGGLVEAVASARGKVLVWWDAVRRADRDLLRRLAEPLEDNRVLASGPTPGDALAVRRWHLGEDLLGRSALVDADATPVPPEHWLPAAAAVDRLAGGEWPEDGPPVMLQEPDEEGPIPGWLLEAMGERTS